MCQDRRVRRYLNTVVKQCVRTDRSAEHLDKVLKQDVREIRILKEEDPPFPSSASQEEVLKPLVPNPYENNSWLAIEIEKLLNKKSRMANSKFKFEVNSEAASSNFNKLAKNNFNLEELLNPTGRCTTSYGSEFKEVNELEGLLSKHPRWNDLKEKLTNGCEYHLEDLPEDQRLQDLQERIERGYHKSAKKHEKFLSRNRSSIPIAGISDRSFKTISSKSV